MIVQGVPSASCISGTLNNAHCYSSLDDYKVAPIQRVCLNSSFPLGRLNRSVRFEIAQLEDIGVVHRFILNEFGHQEPLNRALGITVEDLDEPINDMLEALLPQGVSILVVDQGSLCGIVINSIASVDRSHIKEPKIQEDYGKELDTKTEVSPRLCRIYTILGEMESFLPNFLPFGCSNYFKIDIISVRPEYAGCGLGKQLMIESFRLAHANEIEFCEATCTATASTKISRSLGLNHVFSFPYNAYKYHGKPVFNDKMYDGCESANLMIGDLKEIVQKL